MVNFPFLAGFTASMLHVVSGPDHLAAVTPLATETRRKVWRIGIFWGVGHLTGMLAIGSLFLLFKEFVPVETISTHSEQLVGIVLVGVGVWALFRIFRKGKGHKHPHVHGGETLYIHVNAHGDTDLMHEHPYDKTLNQNSWSSFAIGVLHGLAGIAHFLLLMPVLGFENQAQGAFYIAGFALGTLVAMAIYAHVLGQLSKISEKMGNPNLSQGIRIVGGFFAIVVGVYWLYMGF